MVVFYAVKYEVLSTSLHLIISITISFQFFRSRVTTKTAHPQGGLFSWSVFVRKAKLAYEFKAVFL